MSTFFAFIVLVAMGGIVIGCMNLKGGKRVITILVSAAIMIGSFSLAVATHSGSSGSGTNWSDLSEAEKQNARNAYEIKQWID